MSTKNYLKKINNWDEAAARHILSRTLFGFTRQDVDFALSVTLDEFVDEHLLKEFEAPEPPGDWVTEFPDYSNGQLNRQRFNELGDWWLNLMTGQGYSIREKMVLFLHNHFVSEAEVVKLPQYMYIQNKLFREYACGNFIELTKKVTVDPAMLRYLNGVENSKNKPNENYARELLELFTIGIGNYTEDDIKEGARALTGWRINGLESIFFTNLFDSGIKNFLGEQGNFNHEDIIDIIFSKEATSKFLCKKLYANFVHYEPGEEYSNQLAEIMRDNNYELKPVLSAMLKSQYFHSEEIRSAKIKSPVEFLLSTILQFKILNPDYGYLSRASQQLQQALFNPPDVRGWEGQRKWISTNTYPLRNIFTDSIVTGKKYPSGNLSFSITAIEYARSYESSEDAIQLIEDITNNLIQFPLSAEKKELLLEIMLDGAEVYDWSTYLDNADARLKGMLQTLMRLPEYQLS